LSDAGKGGQTPKQPLSAYQRRLFWFLGVATFFEGYDFFALTQVLPSIREDFGLDRAAAGYLVGAINLGTLLAYALVSRADRWGRRRVLSVTILGYALFTFLSGLSPNVWVFGALQLIARIFLIGEWATSMVIAAEEFPASRRGTVLGVISASASLGAVICAGVVPIITRLGTWRAVYLVGVLPLLLMAWARRDLRETERFEQSRTAAPARSLFVIFSSPYRRRMLQLAAIWFLTYVCTQNGVTFWKDYALGELHLKDTAAALVVTLGAIVSMPLVFFAGKLFDLIGRRRGAVFVYATVVGGVLGCYTFTGQAALIVSMIVAMFGLSSVLSLLNTFTTELFPTELRGDAFVWSNNLLGRVGYVLSPLAIGMLASERGWGPVLQGSVIFPAVALLLLLLWLPETRGKELEQTAALERSIGSP
jgi:MFS transporter, putative metabolite:H+ symporter